MSDLKLGIFEIFSAFLPGLPYLLGVFILSNDNEISLLLLQKTITELKGLEIGGLVTIAYFIGFSSQYLAYEVFKLIVQNVKLWKGRLGDYPVSIGKRGFDIAKIRHRSFENYQTLNAFLALRIMCYNMFFSLGLVCLSIILSSLFYPSFNLNLFYVFVACATFMILFLRRAVSYHEWSHGLISDSIRAIEWLLKKEN